MAGANALCKTTNLRVLVVVDIGTSLQDGMSVMRNIIPSPRCTAATHELTCKENVNYKTISERDREI